MIKYCPECGKKVDPTDKYCKECGTAIVEPVKVQKKESEFEKPPTPVQVPSKPSGPAWSYTITNIFGVLIGLGTVFLVLYSLGCAMGMFPNTEDRACQSIYQAFSKGGDTSTGGKTTGGGTQIQPRGGCSPGYCWSNGKCCPSTHRYYCEGKCYASQQDAYRATLNTGCINYKIIC